MTDMTDFERINTILVRKFNHELVRNPEMMDNLPDDAHIVPLIKGHEAFNEWSRREARIHRVGAETVFVQFEFQRSETDQPLAQHLAETPPDHFELQPA